MRSIFLMGAAIGALFSSSASFAQQHSLAEDAAAFGAREAVSRPRLSPDGSSVLYLTPGPGAKTYAVISNLDTGKSNVMIATDGSPESLSVCNFASATRAVCAINANVKTIGYLVGMRRQIAMDLDGSHPKLLGQPQRDTDAYLRQYDAAILDWRGGRDGQVLMERQYVPEVGKIGTNIIDSRQGLGVDLVDTATLRSTQVEKPNRFASGFMTDGRGNVRIMAVVEDDQHGQVTGRIKYFYRTAGTRDWKTLVDYQEDQFEPLEVDADLDSVYALRKKNGRYALYRIRLDGSLSETLIAENPKVDIDGVVRIGDGQRVVGYTFEGDKRQTNFFDPEFKALAASLSKAMPKLPLVSFVDSTADGRKLLIFAGSDNDPGRFFLFDRDKKSLNEAMLERPELEKYTLANVKPVTVPAADGTPILAYLTLPPGKEAKDLPAVVFPHGGPSARDSWEFDWIPQFLAARGYAVIQPQYRGSAGFGEEWQNENGFKNWRTAISDISASARWMASQGIANPKRLAIFGWSYGGYAALQSAATEPSLYKAAIAVAPVVDLQMLKDDARHYTSENYINSFIGSGPHVVEGSPLKQADSIRVPVLLAHGDLDTNVDIRHSENMASALRGRGKQVEYLSFRGLDHQLRDASVRSEILSKSAELLDQTIGH